METMKGFGKRRKFPPENSRCGQALIEFLVLLPVILLLFLATAEIPKLFAISGKTEIASRYLALRNFRGGPFELADRDFQDALDPAVAADEVANLFFKGTLDDPDKTDVDTGYHEFEPGEGGIFNYTPPPLDSPFWTVITTYFDPSGNLFPIRAHRTTFTYDLPFFPYKEIDAPRSWAQDTDPLGPYDLYTAKGDFVMVNDSFSGDTDNFLGLLGATGIIFNVPGYLLSISISLLIFLVLFL
jgi:hypothetical protein